jgi:hypothetical protein
MVMATFSEQPAETKINAFQYVRNKNDRARVRLVSRDWVAHMAPIQWKTLTMNPNSATSHNLAAILHPKNNVLRHIRYIDMDNTSYTEWIICPPELDSALRIVIVAPPRNNLHEFRSDLAIALPCAIRLLQCQQTMEIFEVCIDGESYDSPVDLDVSTFLAWMTSALTHLQRLTVQVEQNCPDSYKSSGILINNAQNLRQLCIVADGADSFVGVESGRLDVFQGVNAGGPVAKPLHLLNLELYYLNLTNEPTLAKHN